MQVPGQLPGAENGFVEVDVETMDEDKCTLLGRIVDLTITNTEPGTALTEGGALTNGIGSSLTYSTSQVIIR